ncbi:MAG: response regulator, partial [Candidatus Angelobacter sp.]
MSLRILFADDSVTAQNMGKKILTEAGYEVVAVSNGAAAVKKIAEQKPDIIILDVYMPGYSGLEVCEKVRASMATIKTPVLLTVGKMEPYRPEDANRVRADGVIIKPFEASDLLAIIKKFEERIGEAAVPVAAPVVAEPPPEPAVEPEPEYDHRQHTTPSNSHFTVDVPDHMATASAFSDLLGSEPGHVMPGFATAAPNRVPDLQPLAAVPARAVAAAPDYAVPASWQPEVRPVEAQTVVTETAPPRPLQIPVYREPELAEYEVVPTSAAPTGEIEIPQEPALQENDAEATRNTVADARDPGLVSTVMAEEESHEAVRDPGFVPISASSPEMPEAGLATEQMAQVV